jgi:hypothetical protein
MKYFAENSCKLFKCGRGGELNTPTDVDLDASLISQKESTLDKKFPINALAYCKVVSDIGHVNPKA